MARFKNSVVYAPKQKVSQTLNRAGAGRIKTEDGCLRFLLRLRRKGIESTGLREVKVGQELLPLVLNNCQAIENEAYQIEAPMDPTNVDPGISESLENGCQSRGAFNDCLTA
jgi:hypothetical protein